MKALFSFLFFWLVLTCFVIAHPVTYKGGFATSALQTRNDTTIYLNYSISQKKSYGVQFVSLSDYENSKQPLSDFFNNMPYKES